MSRGAKDIARIGDANGIGDVNGQTDA